MSADPHDYFIAHTRRTGGVDDVPAFVTDTATIRWLHETQIVDGDSGISMTEEAVRDLDPDGKHVGIREHDYREPDTAWLTWAMQMKGEGYSSERRYMIQMHVNESALERLQPCFLSRAGADRLKQATFEFMAHHAPHGTNPDGWHRASALRESLKPGWLAR